MLKVIRLAALISARVHFLFNKVKRLDSFEIQLKGDKGSAEHLAVFCEIMGSWVTVLRERRRDHCPGRQGGGREKLGSLMGSNVGRNKAELSLHRSYENVLQLPNIAKFHNTCYNPIRKTMIIKNMIIKNKKIISKYCKIFLCK